MLPDTKDQPLDPLEFCFWNAPADMTLSIAEDEEIKVPQIPLPIKITDMRESGMPTEKAIGDGLYDYLCRFPFCLHAADYAKILQQAYPFLISDIGSQLILLDFKNVAPDGLKRKIALLTILNYLGSDNFGLLHKLGVANFDLGLHYTELSRVKFQLKEARVWLEKARRVNAEDTANLNYLGQVCYLNGAYHQARLYWQIAADQLEEGEAKNELMARLARIDAGNLPESPLVESLERVAAAMEYMRLDDHLTARELLEKLEQIGDLPRELPNAEFFYLLGLCRENCDDPSGAYESFSTALELDKNHPASQQALERLHISNKG